MNNSLSAMDAALATLNQTDPLYQTLYNAYLGACANHKITRSGEWNKTYNQAEIDAAVNMSPYLTSGWYHQGPSQGTHTIYARGSWSFSDLKELHPCNGPCTVKHRTHWEAFDAHHTKCGTADNVDNIGTGVPTTYILRGYTVEQGCGRPYYDCPNAPDTWHKERTCTVVYTYADGSTGACLDSDREPLEYRRCMGHTRDHDKSDSKSSPTFHTLHNNDEYEANAGGTLHACDIHDASASGDHSSTYLCNISPCSNRQVPYCLALCPYTGNHGTATTPMHACNIHDTSVSGDHSSTYLCNIPPCSNRIVPYCLALCPYTDTHGTTTITPGDEDTSGGTTPTTPTASLGPDIGYSTTITLGSQTLLVLQASAAFRSVTWYILSPGNDSESWMGTYTYSDGATTATYVPYFGGGVGDYEVRVEVTPVTGDTYSVSCTVTVQ